jgi:uncharacterized protein
MATITRRHFVKRSSAVGGGLAGVGALQAFGAQVAAGQAPGTHEGYGPLVLKTAQNDPSMQLMLPERFNFVVVSRQGVPMSDGNPTPGIFDGTGSYFLRDEDVTILIRNHENRRRLGEIPVIVPADKRRADPWDGCSTWPPPSTGRPRGPPAPHAGAATRAPSCGSARWSSASG